MRGFFNKHTVIKVLATIALFELINSAIHYVFNFFGITFGISNKSYFAQEVIFKLLPILFIAFIFKTIDVLKPSKSSKKSFFKGLISGGTLLGFIVLGIIVAIELVGEGRSFKRPGEIIYFLLFTLAIGYSEEILFRGTVTEILLRKHGNTKKGIWFSVIIGAVLFGAVHITNIFYGQAVNETILQVFCNILTGSLYCAIYARHRNIHVVSILHGLFDFIIIMEIGLFNGHSLADMYAVEGRFTPVKSILKHSIFLINALIILRSKKINDIINKNNDDSHVLENEKNTDKIKKSNGIVGKILYCTGVIVAVFGILMAAFVISSSILNIINPSFTENQVTGYAGEIGTLITAVIVTLFVAKKKIGNKNISGKWKINYRIIITAIVSICILKILLESTLGICLNRVLPVESNDVGNPGFMEYIMIILVGPIFEELMFRYGVYNLLRRKTGKTFAIIVGSLFFAALHVYNIQGFIETFVAGVVFSIIYEMTGNIWYNIFCHMMCNAYSTIENALVNSGIAIYTEKNGYVINNFAVIAAAAVICIIAAIVVKKKGTKHVQDTCC